MGSYPAVAESLALVRADLWETTHRLGFDGAVAATLVQAASEAASNAIVHGHGGGDAGASIDVEAGGDASAMTVTVLDRGSGFRPRRNSPGLGLGLALIAQLADELELQERDGGGICIWMRFLAAG